MLFFLFSFLTKTKETMDNQLDYEFAARYLAVYKKICAHKKCPPNYNFISSNPLITMAYVNKHPEEPWCTQGLTANPSISIAYMDAHPEFPWQQDEYHFRKYGGEAEVTECEDLADVDTGEMLLPSEWHCKNVSLDLIEKYMPEIDEIVALGYDEDEEVDLGYLIWCHISENPNITLEFLEKYYQKPWTDILAINPLTKAKAAFVLNN